MGSEKLSTDGFIILLTIFARSPVRHFESCLRLVVGSDEDDIRITLKQFISTFVTRNLSSGIYTIKGIAEAVSTMGDHKGSLQIE